LEGQQVRIAVLLFIYYPFIIPLLSLYYPFIIPLLLLITRNRLDDLHHQIVSRE
jgi:hypothetical protein